MKGGRWPEVERLCQAALDCEAGARASFLDRACSGDEELRREVETLLSYEARAEQFISSPAIEVVAEALAEERPESLSQGQRVGPYRIDSLLGAGGMGEVYLAEDARLGRRVALKLLPDNPAAADRWLPRFRQEARAASSLNHPNILTVYEVGEHEGRSFIATEYVAGETLRSRLRRAGGMSVAEALDVATQVASALSAAHAAKIIHRDIKPENVMLRPDGYVKVLDFGLAKLTGRDVPAGGLGGPPGSEPETAPGLLMGTIPYMSPEQVRGREVDARTDVWSLGCVLYEMVAGRAPFSGETPADVLSLILHREPPPLARGAPEAAEELERIVARSLTKDAGGRYQTAEELLADLKRLRRRLDVEAGAAEARRADAGGVESSSRGRAPAPAPESSAGYPLRQARRHARRAALAISVLLVAASAAAYFAYIRPARGGRDINSLAVLPLANAGDDPDAEYLADGISESLINSLSRLPNLRVISRNAAFRYKGQEADARAVGRALGVEAVLTGRVTRRGDSLTLSVELVDARDNRHLWGERYDRRVSDLLAVRHEIAREVSGRLRLDLTGEERRRVTKHQTESAEAYELYLKGQYFWRKTTEESYRKAIEHYRRAIEIDPNYAEAYVGMARVYGGLGNFLGFVSPGEVAPQGKAAVLKALAIDETLDDAHATLASFKLLYDWDWAGAERELRRAIELNPNNVSAHFEYGTYFEALGRFDEAVAARERSRQLEPTSPILTADVGYPLYYARRYPEALEYYRKALELDPNLSWVHLWIGQVYVQQGRHVEAIDEINKAVELSGGNVRDIATLGHAYAVSGRRREALKVLEELRRRGQQRYVSPYFVALIYTGLGEKERAFEWLERAYRERHPYLILIKVEPVFDTLRSDPRYSELLRRMNLPE